MVAGDPVFVVGSARSGTTLVYSILISSGAFAVYEAETRLLDRCPAQFGPLARSRSRARFLDAWFRSKQFARSGLDSQTLTERVADVNGYEEFLGRFMDCVAASQGVERWAENTPNHVFHLESLGRAFPTARFIHVIRDGRDVALSRLSTGWTGSRSRDRGQALRSAALAWEIAVTGGRSAGAALGDRYLELRYEELTTDPEATLERLGGFVEADLSPERLRRAPRGALARPNSLFLSAGDGGISAASVGRFRTGVERETLERIESDVGASLVAFGYPLTTREVPPASRSVATVARSRWMRLRRFLGSRTPLARLRRSDLEPA